MEKIIMWFNNITEEQVATCLDWFFITVAIGAVIAFIVYALSEMDVFEFTQRRLYRAGTTMSVGVWLVLNAIVGILVILMKQGVVSEFVDLHTPPARQFYIGISSIILGLFAITLFLYIFKLRVKYEKKDEMPKGLKKLAKWFGLYTLGIAGFAFSIIGILAILGIYDMSYERRTALIFFSILIGVSVLTGLAAVIVYIMFKCGFTIVKDTAEFRDGSVWVAKKFLNGNKYFIYQFVASKRSLFGRVYYVNKIACGDATNHGIKSRYKIPVAFVEEMIATMGGGMEEIPLEEAKLHVNEEKREEAFEETLKDEKKYFYTASSWNIL